MDSYQNYHELAEHYRRDVDYTIEYVDRQSEVLILAPHGGRIEPFTSEIASRIAEPEFSYYTLRGNLPPGQNRALHIASHRFDEPIALAAISQAWIGVAIHGHRATNRPAIMIGGLSRAFANVIAAGLLRAGFHVEDCEPHVAGVAAMNIVNRCRSGGGVQLEITRRLRTLLRRDRIAREAFVATVRSATSDFLGSRPDAA